MQTVSPVPGSETTVAEPEVRRREERPSRFRLPKMPRLRMPLSMSLTLGLYILRNRLKRRKRFPLVFMLEPLHACNLTCTGCGRIREYTDTIAEMLSVDECLAAADE